MKLKTLIEESYLDYCWHKSRMLEEMAKKIKKGERDSYLRDWLLKHGVFIRSKERRAIENNDKQVIREQALKNLDWLFRYEYYSGCYKEDDGFWAVIKDRWGFHELEDLYKKIRQLPDDHDDED
jgi:hypothetical protein